MTQNEAILKDLMEGKRITSLDAWVDYGCCSLHSRISDLRNKLKIPVSDIMIKVIGKDGEVKHVKEYYLEQSTIETIKQSKKAA